MGLLSVLRNWLFGAPAAAPTDPAPRDDSQGRGETSQAKSPKETRPPRSKSLRIRLTKFRYAGGRRPRVRNVESRTPPYLFAFPTFGGAFLDLSQGGDSARLEQFGVPRMTTPRDIADWLQIPLGHVAWLTYRFCDSNRPQTPSESHYHFHWSRKKSGGHRLIEAPKTRLREVQWKILREILDRVPAHPAAHGFVPGRSILTNAQPHIGQRFLVKFDLENFYPSVRYSRVVAIFRSIGYSREVAIWLARLTTSLIPTDLPTPGQRPSVAFPYFGRHLPQGAPTSPALANLSALGLDIRLSGLARSYGLTYTRYADDLTFSGPGRSAGALREFLPLIQQIVNQERFRINKQKRRIIRSSQQMCVTGVVVNEKQNVAREDYDELKAILHNCLRQGPDSQNRYRVPNFAEHLRGRIAHVNQLNPARGARLLAEFQKIRWPS